VRRKGVRDRVAKADLAVRWASGLIGGPIPIAWRCPSN